MFETGVSWVSRSDLTVEGVLWIPSGKKRRLCLLAVFKCLGRGGAANQFSDPALGDWKVCVGDKNGGSQIIEPEGTRVRTARLGGKGERKEDNKPNGKSTMYSLERHRGLIRTLPLTGQDVSYPISQLRAIRKRLEDRGRNCILCRGGVGVWLIRGHEKKMPLQDPERSYWTQFGAETNL